MRRVPREAMTALRQLKRRKIVFISPRFQGGLALAFSAAFFVGWAVFSWLVVGDVRRALQGVSLTAHYQFGSAYDVVGATVVRHLAGLFVGVLLAGIALFFLVLSRIRVGTERIVAVFRLSGEGDLSKPADAPGVAELHALGKQVDAARARTLEVIDGIRAEVDLMRKESLPEDEFMKRWEGLKETIGRLAP